MKLVVNGKDSEVGEAITVSQLLEQENVKMPEMVSVEVNGQILKRSQFDSTTLGDGDAVEFLYFMGGGRGTH